MPDLASKSEENVAYNFRQFFTYNYMDARKDDDHQKQRVHNWLEKLFKKRNEKVPEKEELLKLDKKHQIIVMESWNKKCRSFGGEKYVWQ